MKLEKKMKKIISIALILFITIGCTNSESKIEVKKNAEFNLPIKLPLNFISEKECVSKGGEVWNTLGKTTYEGDLIGRIKGMRCPCACLVKVKL